MIARRNKLSQPGGGKRERYIQPSVLIVLYRRPAYGYELIQNIHKFGFVEGMAPPGMIYRHLHQLEDDGLVASQWETEGSGPAKRVYQLTPDGEEMLAAWIEYMKEQAKNLTNFINYYQQIYDRTNPGPMDFPSET